MSEPDWSFACPDWEEKLQRGETPIADLPLDQVEAEVAVALFDKLRLPDINGQPTMKDAAGEWCRDIVRAAFGSVDPATGVRRVGEVFNLIPKKNSKTTNAAALGIVALLMNRTPNIDGVIIGPTQEVADKCFAQAAGMIAADPYLSRRFKVIHHLKTIVDLHRDEETGVVRNARLKIKSFDLKVVTGGIPAFAIIDELHIMAKSPQASRIIAQIRGGMITNPESLLIFITTQSDEPPAGAFKAELDYARGVRDGRVTKDVRMLPVLYEFPERIQTSDDKAWRDPKLWPMVLPNLGRSITLERLVSLHTTAQEKGIEEEAIFASQHLNIQIGMALHTDRWIGADYWQAAGEPGLDLDEIIERCDVLTVGVDGGGLDDLLGFGVIGREIETRDWLHWGRAWAHPEALERRKENAALMRDFEADGDLVICEDANQDVVELCDIIERLWSLGMLPKENGIGLDPAGIVAIVDELASRGIPDEALIGVGQGYRLQPAVLGIERKLKHGGFRHGAQPLMAWSVANAKVEQRGNAVVITKQTAGKAKIDPLIALLNAGMLMSRNPEADGGSTVIPDEIRAAMLEELG